jgi:hypothetical protein
MAFFSGRFLGPLAHHLLGQGDVFQHGLVGKQVERLEHHAHLGIRTLLMSVFWVRMSMPSMKMCPLVARSSRLRQRRKVLLPEPEGPITTTTSPAAILDETSTSALTSWGT